MNDERYLPGLPLRFANPLDLYPGIRVFDKGSRRQGEIIKIEIDGRNLPEIFIVFDNSDTPVNAIDYPNLVILED
jgi:hypothetical protein